MFSERDIARSDGTGKSLRRESFVTCEREGCYGTSKHHIPTRRYYKAETRPTDTRNTPRGGSLGKKGRGRENVGRERGKG